MENNKASITKDSQKFTDKFEPNKFKILKSGIEIRAHNLEQSITYATELIQKMKLKLSVKRTADMAMYGGFEIIIT